MKLAVENVTVQFGGVVAVSDVSLTAEEGAVTTILGPNGAGKTTLFNLITSVVSPTAGRVFADGQDITNWPTFAIARHGVVRTFQKLRLFKTLTVRENITTAALSIGKVGWFSAAMGSRSFRNEANDAKRRAAELLEIVGLSDRADELPGNLPHGEQRLVEIGRALALQPQVLLLDEPMAGLNDQECGAVSDVVVRVRDEGVTIVMIEHHVDAALAISDHAVVLDFGKPIFDGTPADCRRDGGVRKAYLGGIVGEEE